MAYRVTCERSLAPRGHRGLSEWHRTLASALAAMLEHQQRLWDSICLSPAAPQPRRTL